MFHQLERLEDGNQVVNAKSPTPQMVSESETKATGFVHYIYHGHTWKRNLRVSKRSSDLSLLKPSVSSLCSEEETDLRKLSCFLEEAYASTLPAPCL